MILTTVPTDRLGISGGQLKARFSWFNSQVRPGHPQKRGMIIGDSIFYGPVLTNTSAQIRYRLSIAAAVGTAVLTNGWIDFRGQE